MAEESVYNSARDHALFSHAILINRRVSAFYLVGLFDLWTGLRTLLISSGGAYIISSQINSPYMPWIGFVFLMGHMSINHVFRMQVADESQVDITGRFANGSPFSEVVTNSFFRGANGLGYEGMSSLGQRQDRVADLT
jgi:hypothetical protein